MAESGIDIASASLDEFTEVQVKELIELRPWMKTKLFRLLTKKHEIEEYFDRCIEKGICSYDLETTGLNTREDPEGGTYAKIVGLCLAHDPDEGIYIPIAHEDAQEFNVSLSFILRETKRLVANCVLIFHNFKYDGQILRANGIIIDSIDQYEDTYLMASIEDASRKIKGLKYLSETLLDRPQLEINDLGIQGTKKNIVAFHMVPPQKAVYYGGGDGMNTLALYLYLKNRLDKINGNEKMGPWFIYRIEKRCQFVTMEMERNLVKIDKEYLISVNADIEKRMAKLVKDIFSIAGHEFDINSTQQLGVVLFEELKLPYPAKAIKTKTGHHHTNSEILELVSTKNPIINLILTYRGYVKIRSTYLHNWLVNADENDEVKFQLNQVQADTGRFSGSGGKGLLVDGYCGVNCQNIPTYDKSDPHAINLRRAMIAHHGFKMVSIDYSGEELRIATNFSREPKWIQEFLHGIGDLHTITGKIITGKTEITKKERSMGKCVAKGTLIASEMGWIPIEELKEGDKVVTHTGELKRVTAVHFMGVKKAKVIESTTGYKIICGYNHRFLTTEDKWVRAEDLREGQELKSISCEQINPTEIYKVHFNFWDKGNNNFISESLPYIEINPLRARLIGYLCIIGKVFRVPDFIFKSPKYISKEFLKRLFEADGTVDSLVSVCIKDKELAQDIVLLLSSFGIKAYIYTKPSKKYKRDYYQVQMGRVAANKFAKEIGFISKLKTNKLKAYVTKPMAKCSRKNQYWNTKIKNIELVKKVELWDISIEDDHTYVAQGFVTHNTLNFLTMYGGGAGGFAAQAKIAYDTAKKMILNFFKQYSGLEKWIKIECKASRKRGYSKTAFGRRRPLDEYYNHPDKGIQAKGDRCAINSAIQGCLMKEEKCLTDKYGYIPIIEIKKLKDNGEDLKIWTGTTWETFDVLNRGEAQLAIIELSNGMILRCDTRHEVLVVGRNGYEFRHFENIDENTDICVSIPSLKDFGVYPEDYHYKSIAHNDKNFQINTPEQWDFIAYLMGYVIGYGNIRIKSRQSITLCLDKEKIKKYLPNIKNSLENFGLCLSKINKIYSAKGESYQVSINSKGLVDLFTKLGYKSDDARHKRIPEVIFKVPVSMRKSFLQGYFDTDGCKKRRNRYGFHTPNMGLLRDVQLIGWTLGIPSRIYPVNRGNFKLEWQDLKKVEELLEIQSTKWKRRNTSNKMLLPDFLRKEFHSKLFPIYDRKSSKDCSYFSKLNTGKAITLPGMISMLEDYNCDLPKEIYYHYKLKKKVILDKKEETYTLSVHSDLHRFDSVGIISKNTGADVIKIAMWRVYRWIQDNNLQEDIRILLPVHDEILFEVREEKMHMIIPELCELMKIRDVTDKLKWVVPLEVDAEYGDTFYVDHDYWKEVKEKSKEEVNPIQKKVESSKETVSIKKSEPVKKETKESVVEEESTKDCTPSIVGTASMETMSYCRTMVIKDNNQIGEVAKKNDSKLLINKVEQNLFVDADYSKNIDKDGYFNYPVNFETLSAKKLRFIFDMIQETDNNLYIGPKMKICLIGKNGEILHKTVEKMSVDAFIVLCTLYLK